jgi:hypothetical protein
MLSDISRLPQAAVEKRARAFMDEARGVVYEGRGGASAARVDRLDEELGQVGLGEGGALAYTLRGKPSTGGARSNGI